MTIHLPSNAEVKKAFMARTGKTYALVPFFIPFLSWINHHALKKDKVKDSFLAA
jgi:phenylalanine-4-hydroxylase